MPFADAVNVLRGTVTQSLYYGDAIEYRVTANGFDVVSSMTDRERAGRPESRIPVGQSIHVRLDPDLVVPLKAT